MGKLVVIKGMEELRQRMQAYPQQYNAVVKKMLETLLLVLHEKVPDYPPPPEGSKYVRTMTLFKSIGVGGQNQPDIYEVNQHGGQYDEGRFGTNLEYAPYVIGTEQAAIHEGRWWKLEDVPKKAASKINSTIERTKQAIINFLNGQGTR